jgi:hypothetical protein
MKTIAGFALLFLFALPNYAQEPDTSDGTFLIGSCQLALRFMDNPNASWGVYDAWRAGYCIGIVKGVGDEAPNHCIPESVNTGQAIRVVLKFLQDHPEKLHERGTWLTAEALRKGFTCSK